MAEPTIAQAQHQKLNIVIRDRSGMLYQGEGEAVSSFNDKGPFDILPMHANFICLIHESVTVHISSSEEKTIPVQSGVVKVKKDIIEIYLGIIR